MHRTHSGGCGGQALAGLGSREPWEGGPQVTAVLRLRRPHCRPQPLVLTSEGTRHFLPLVCYQSPCPSEGWGEVSQATCCWGNHQSFTGEKRSLVFYISLCQTKNPLVRILPLSESGAVIGNLKASMLGPPWQETHTRSGLSNRQSSPHSSVGEKSKSTVGFSWGPEGVRDGSIPGLPPWLTDTCPHTHMAFSLHLYPVFLLHASLCPDFPFS